MGIWKSEKNRYKVQKGYYWPKNFIDRASPITKIFFAFVILFIISLIFNIVTLGLISFFVIIIYLVYWIVEISR